MPLDLQNHIHTFALPTPFPVGDINVYLIDAAPLTLIDTGVNGGKSMAALEKALGGLGRRVEDLARVVLTHGHFDHCGSAFEICRRSGARLLMHRKCPAQIVRPPEQKAQVHAFLVDAGMPEHMLERMQAVTEATLPFGPQGEFPPDVTLLDDGDAIAFDDFSLRVLHTPGHAPDQICLLADTGGVVFSGDHLLPAITPNPLIHFDPENDYRRVASLKLYLDSLDRLEAYSPQVAYPGHGAVIADPCATIAKDRAFIAARKEKFKAHFIACAGLSLFETAQRYFGQLDALNVYLAISETVAYRDIVGDDLA